MSFNLATQSRRDVVKVWSLGLATLFVVALAIGAPVASAANAQPVQVFFLPLPEDQIRTALYAISTATGTTMHSITGLSITANGTVIYYDQWENGYELDIANPTQINTQIWGDGNAANGCPPNINGTPLTCTNGNDVLAAGNVIVLENDVALPRNPATVLYDGRDKVGATRAIAVTRSAWATTPGTVLADAVEAYDTTRWGANFRIPIGQNLSSSFMFEYTSLLVMASQDGTVVQIDKDGNGTVDDTQTLSQGQAYQISGGISSNALVTSSKPIQVNLITGDVGSTYESRWFAIPPTDQLGSSYYTPVGTTSASYPADVFLYNPSQTVTITVNYQTKAGSGTLSIPAKGTARYEMPLNSGAHFWTTNGASFLGVGTMDSSTSGADQTFDWGYTLVPDSWLTTAFAVGWAPGTADLSGNGSPVWVTAVQPTTIYVKYDGNVASGPNTAPNGLKYDVAYALGSFELKTIYDPDKNQTGMRVFTADGTLITGAWGEDPAKASPGTPYLDAGYTIPPLPQVVVSKDGGLRIDVGGGGQVDPGDTLAYTVTVKNTGAVTLFGVVVSETLPLNTSYVTNSTTLNGSPLPDSGLTRFPLDEGGINVGTLVVGNTAVITYGLRLNDFPPVYSAVTNTAEVFTSDGTFNITVATPVNTGNVTACAVRFTDATGTLTATTYLQNGRVYVQVSDNDQNISASTAQTITAQLLDTTGGDYESLVLTETGVNTGVFSGTLPSSTTGGQLPNDGVLYAQIGDTLQAAFSDNVYAPDTCSATAQVTPPIQTKSLYFSLPGQSMDRVDPVATGMTNTAVSNFRLGPSAGGGGTFTTTLTTNRDTYLRSGAATNNYGIATTLNTNYNSTNRMRSLLGFDISSIPAGATINSATLRLVKTGGNTNAFATAVYRVTADWTEGTANGAAGVANWNQRLTGTNWTTAGGDFSATAFDTVTVSSNTTYNWNVTSLVQGWYNNTYPNYGILLKQVSEAGTRNRTQNFASRENTTVANRPALIVSYTLPTTVVTNTTFTQATPMGSDFIMPAGGPVTVTTFISLTSGSLPTPLPVTATLEISGTPFITLTNPTVTLISSPVYKLVWTGSLPSGKTVSAGQQVTTRFTMGAATGSPIFAFLYGSQPRPSKIDLPTTTVIDVTSLSFYDAAYPAGAPLTSPANGQTVYIRTTVSDPFGPQDIISATLNIVNPSGGTTSVVLTDTYTVNTTAATKTYEYSWFAPATQGTYTFTVTANEGYEGTIRDSQSQSLSIINQDTGTPSRAEFTTGLNGLSTATYSPNEQVCVRITDFDQNTNPAVAETITATIRSASGDTEVVTLTETGPDTGIFTKCIPASATTAGSSNNGTLYARQGDQLTVSYTDPNDPTDRSSATAMVSSTSPAESLSKVRVAPADGIAVVGELVQFDLTIANPGTTVLSTVPVTDTFPSSCLAYDSASIAPDGVVTPTLTWADVGPLNPGESTSISVYFRVTAACTPATNQANASAIDELDAVLTTGTVTATVTTTRPQVTLSKALISGTPVVSNTLTYRISITNTGSTTITSLPLQDNYSASCIEYQSATPAANGAGGGTALWNNLGPLSAGITTSVVITFVVQGPCSPALNTAVVDNATDANGDAVPPAQGSASVATTAQPPQIALLKTLTAPASGIAGVGDTITYTVRITNTGPNAFTSLALTDTYNSACQTLTWWGAITPTQTITGQAVWNTLIPPQPPLLPGQAMSLTLGFRTLALSTSCTNTVTLSGFDRYGQPISAGPGSASVQVQPAALNLTKTSQPSPAVPGRPLTYTVVITNSGPGVAQGVVVTDTLPLSVTYSSHTASQGAFTSGTSTWTVGNLASSASATLTLVINLDPAATQTLTNVVRATATSPVTGTLVYTNTNTPQPQADLSLSKVSTPKPYVPGQAITYTLVVSNAGPSTLSAITLTDNLPAAVLAPVYTPSSGSFNSGNGAWTGLGLAAGGRITLTIAGTVALTSTGTLQNSAVVTPTAATDPNPANNTATDANPQALGTLVVDVFNDLNGNGVHDAGEGFANVRVVITPSIGTPFTITTDAAGFYTTTVPAGATTVDVNYADLPPGVSQTVGSDPTIVNVPVGGIASDVNGYRLIYVRLGDITWSDGNGDGVQQIVETEGVPHIPLRVIGLTFTGATVDITVTTSITGFYRVDNLLPGTYTVTAPAAYNGFQRSSASPLITTLTAVITQNLTLDFGYILPTAVRLDGFSAEARPGQVRLAWQVWLRDRAAPAFDVWRVAVGSNWKRLTVTAVEPTAGDPENAAYVFLDTVVEPAATYLYRLASTTGDSYGPWQVRVPAANETRRFLPLIGK